MNHPFSAAKLLAAAALTLLATAAPAAFVINETDSDTTNTPSTDFSEYVELKGNANESVAGLTIVFFNGGTGNANPPAYRAMDLTGNANASGYYIIANPGVVSPDPAVTFPSNTLQNGEDAVALCSGTTAAAWGGTVGPFATLQAPPTGNVFVDSIVYQTGADANATWTGLPSTTVYDEFDAAATALSGDFASLSRVPDGTGTFQRTNRTPLATNDVGPVAAVQDWQVY
ncbi:MAG: hypothetical protein ACR2IE_08715 [Candidatus Sumerlaeaceae bacterium]